jgi:PAS domain-containing protein
MQSEAHYPYHEMVEFAAVVTQTSGFVEALAKLVELFNVKRFVADIDLHIEAEARECLEAKLAAHLLDQVTTERAEAPYITVWEQGRHKEAKMVYINPAIEKITGFSASQVLRVGFGIFVPNDLITKIDRSGDNPARVEVPIEMEREERRAAALKGRWERIYDILTKDGVGVVKDVAFIETVGDLCISCGTLIDVTAETGVP